LVLVPVINLITTLTASLCLLGGGQIFILDPYGNLCPIGVVGEIFIGGVHLTRGYLDRPGTLIQFSFRLRCLLRRPACVTLRLDVPRTC
jgi:hypothetical protein